MDRIVYILNVSLVGLSMFFLGYLLRRILAAKGLKNAEGRAKLILEEAKKEAAILKKTTEIESKELLIKTKQEFEEQTKQTRQELLNLEKRLIQKEGNLDRKVDVIDRKEKAILERERIISNRERELSIKENDVSKLLEEEKENLKRIAGLSSDEAKQLLLERLKDDVRLDAAILIKRIEDEAKQTAEEKAKKIISLAIQRCAAEYSVNSTVTVVNLPNEDMKGRIIGREGRNIRALEIATGVDVIIDDTPEAVTLSGYDVFRREIARTALERLMSDGRIHPGRIEEVVEKVKRDMEDLMREEGEKAVFETGLAGIHPEIIKLLGRLKYRTSYGQNVLIHLKEVAYIMGVMASELGIDVALAKRCGLLHDIGKAVSHDVEGSHAKLGADIARKYNESQEVIHAIEAHHEDVEQRSIYAVLTQAADAISGSRPGARRETLENYIKRLKNLESIADSVKGVDKAFAIQAGREIRVIVQPDRISDLEMIPVAREIAKKVEQGLEYPGQIKVTVIRETRAVEYAK